MLLQLTQIALGQATEVLPALQQLIDERKRPKEGVEAQQQLRETQDLSDAILAKAAIGNRELREKGRELLQDFISRTMYSGHQLAAVTRREYFVPVLEPETVDRLDHEPWNTGLKYWTGGAVMPMQSLLTGADRMWWLANEGLVCHVFGPGVSHFYFNFPLVGEFEVSCDAWWGTWDDNALCLGYGGVNYQGVQTMYGQNFYFFHQLDWVPIRNQVPESYA